LMVSPEASGAFRPPQTYPLPQTPAIEHYRETTTMHQPRPQKAISVSGIDSPATLSLHAPQQQSQQPFENQLPQHMSENGNGAQPMAADGSFAPFYPYAGQSSAESPLSNIPERAIHAQPFQPPMQPYGQVVYGAYPPGGYYYPQSGQQYRQVPMFVPPQPAYAPAPAAPAPHAVSGAAQGPAGTVAHESNGMVYYLDASQMPPQQQQQERYPAQEAYLQPPSYAVPGMGGMMTPSPESGFYYPPVAAGAMFYPQTQ